MIEKIIKVQGIGLLHNALPNGPLELEKVVAIYAENGRGKTTWSTVCHSLATSDGQLLTERATIGGSLSPTVELLIDGACHRFDRGSWGVQCPNLVVFDSGFVDRNVYSGCRVDAEHRENLLEFTLGEQGVALKSDVDEIANKIKTMNYDMQAKEKTIGAYAGSYSVDEFLALRQDPSLDKAIAELKVKIRMAENALAVGKRPTLKEVILPTVTIVPIKALLNETLESLSDSAEKIVREHVEKHLTDGGETWIGQGMRIMKLGSCPFCGRDIEGVQLIKAYREYFSEAYKNLRERVSKAKADMERTLSEQALGEVIQVLQYNSSVKAVWADRPDMVLPDGQDSDSISAAWRTLRNNLVTDLTRKSEQPLSSLAFSPSVVTALDTFDEIAAQVLRYAALVSAANDLLDVLKRSAGTANVVQLREQLQRLTTARKRFEPIVIRECSELMARRAEKRKLETDKATKREHLDAFTDTLMSTLSGAINTRLLALGAEFSIEEMKAAYPGGKPHSDYKLKLRNTLIPLVSGKRTTAGQNFGNTLSDGDRRTLAMAFFLARLDTDRELAKRTVVVDDPVSSFDVSRRRATLEALAGVVSHTSQLIVMSHNADFVRDFAAKVSTDEEACQVLQIHRQGGYSVFDSCDINSICESEYYANYRTLTEYLEQGCIGNPRPIAKAIRPYLEHAFRERFPIEFAEDKRLGHMISRIRGCKPDNPLCFLRARLQETEELHDFASKFHHDSNANAGSQPVTDGELKPIVELALRMGRGAN